jgi:hypothetical protein
MSDAQKSLEARVRELEDVRAINDLWFKWHYECTGGFNGKQAGRMEALECLTEDATIEIQGLHEPGKGPRGRKAYTEFWDYYFGDAGPLPYVFHGSVAERVVVAGDAATQQSNMFGIFQLRGGRPAVGLSQRNHRFVRTAAGWKMSYRDMEGGFSFLADALHGPLNPLPEAEPRTPWTPQG